MGGQSNYSAQSFEEMANYEAHKGEVKDKVTEEPQEDVAELIGQLETTITKIKNILFTTAE